MVVAVEMCHSDFINGSVIEDGFQMSVDDDVESVDFFVGLA